MSLLYLPITLSIVLLTVECSVIKLQDIPLTDGAVMKIVIKGDPNIKGGALASLKIGQDKEGHNVSTNPLNKLMKSLSDVPDFEDRLMINSNKCPSGQVRRGPICV